MSAGKLANTRRKRPGKKPAKKNYSELRKESLKDRQRMQVCNEFLEGGTIRSAAAKAGVTIAFAKELLDEERDVWKRETGKEMLEYRAVELAKIGYLESVAWKAFWRSCEPSQSEVYKVTDGNEPDDAPSTSPLTPEETTKEVAKVLREAAKLGIDVNAKKIHGRMRKNPELRPEVYDEAALWRLWANECEFRKQTRDGNPAFLTIVKQCHERRAAMLGLDDSKHIQGLIEFRVAGVDREDLDRQMVELVVEQVAAMLHPSQN